MQVLFTPRFALEAIAPPRTGVPAHAEAAYRHARGRYIQHLGQATGGTFDRSADTENWHENIAWMLAAFDCGLNVHVIERVTHLTGQVAPLYSQGLDLDPARPTLLFGAVPHISDLLGTDPGGAGPDNDGPSNDGSGINVVWPRPATMRAANAYARYNAFASRAGRRVALCDLAGAGQAGDLVQAGDPGELSGTLAAWAAKGPVDALVKIVCRTKYAAPAPVRLPRGAGLDQAQRAVMDALGYALAHLEGERGAVLLQDRVEMQDEYRVFVVDGVPVTGAGCIEAFTPCDRLPGTIFDPRVEGVRGSGQVREDHTRIAGYRAFAAEAAAALAAEAPDLRDFTLDLATGPDGQPLIVELNPTVTSGLYASRIDRLVQAIRDSIPVERPAVPA